MTENQPELSDVIKRKSAGFGKLKRKPARIARSLIEKIASPNERRKSTRLERI